MSSRLPPPQPEPTAGDATPDVARLLAIALGTVAAEVDQVDDTASP